MRARFNRPPINESDGTFDEPLLIERARLKPERTKGTKMVENFLLEYDKASSYALVKLIDAEHMPYVVAFGYDTEDRDWSQGHYYSKIEDAVAAYRKAIEVKKIDIALRAYEVSSVFTYSTDFSVYVKAKSALDAVAKFDALKYDMCDWIDTLDVDRTDFGNARVVDVRDITDDIDFESNEWCPVD